MPRKLVGYGIGLVMIIVGALWTFGPGSSDGGVLVAPVHPAATANRFVSRGTDVVDGRPWRLASALASE